MGTDDIEYLNIAATARKFGISRSTVYRLLRAGTIRALRHGSRSLVELRTVRDWIAGLPDVHDVAHTRNKNAKPVKRIKKNI
jgi:excisionase family DNA binding protein